MYLNQIRVTSYLEGRTSFVLLGPAGSGKSTLIQNLMLKNGYRFVVLQGSFLTSSSRLFECLNFQLSFLLKTQQSIKNIDGLVSVLKQSYIPKEFSLAIIVQQTEALKLKACAKTISEIFKVTKEIPFIFVFLGTAFDRSQFELVESIRRLPIVRYLPPTTIQLNQIVKDWLTTEHQCSEIKSLQFFIENFVQFFGSYTNNLKKLKCFAKVLYQDYEQILKNTKNIHRTFHSVQFQEAKKKVLNQQIYSYIQISKNYKNTSDSTPLYQELICSAAWLCTKISQNRDFYLFTNTKEKERRRTNKVNNKTYIPRQRLQAVTQALETCIQRPTPERQLLGHSLDFYATMGHLFEIGKLQKSKRGKERVMCKVRGEQVQTFFNNESIDGKQFISEF